ncbi:MAG: hypothetical protein AB1638_12495 [Nitrospirota bacterium]
MNTREHHELFRYLMKSYCLFEEDIVFVENIADWCEEEGIPEPDRERPLKLVSKEGQGCRMVIKEDISDKTIEDRINALRIRSQIENVAFDRADLLDSDKKKLAYLFLSEYATSLPDIDNDELLADDWAFQEMERLEFFKK